MDTTACLRTVRALADGEEAFLAAFDAAAGAGAGDAAGGPVGAAYAAWLRAHRLLPWVEPAVVGAAGRRRLPPSLVEAVDAGREARRRRHAAVVAATLEVEDTLRRADVACLHLKGLSLATRYYGDARRRWQWDVDVLVPEARRAAAFAALEAVGYVPDPGRVKAGVVRWGFRRGEEEVDVHWNLRRRARRRIDEAELWRDTARFEVGGRTLGTMGDEPTLTFLLLAVCGDLRRGACQARHLLDVDRVLHTLAPTFDAEGFLVRREAQGLVGPCVNVLALVVLAFDLAAALPDVARAVARRRRLVHVRDAREAVELLDRPRDSPENAAWFERAYPYDRWSAWARRFTVDLPYTLARWRPSRLLPPDLGRRDPARSA